MADEDDVADAEVIEEPQWNRQRVKGLLTPERLDIIVRAVRNGASIAAACQMTRVSQRAAWKWLAQGRALVEELEESGASLETLDPEYERLWAMLALGVDQARAQCESDMANLLLEKANGGQLIERRVTVRGSGANAVTETTERYDPGDWKAAQFYLKTRGQGRWTESQSIEIAAPGGGGAVADLGDEPEEEIANRLRSFAQAAIAAAPEQQAS